MGGGRFVVAAMGPVDVVLRATHGNETTPCDGVHWCLGREGEADGVGGGGGGGLTRGELACLRVD